MAWNQSVSDATPVRLRQKCMAGTRVRSVGPCPQLTSPMTSAPMRLR